MPLVTKINEGCVPLGSNHISMEISSDICKRKRGEGKEEKEQEQELDLFLCQVLNQNKN